MTREIKETTTDTFTFADFGLPAAVMKGVEAAGFVTPSPIQEAAIPKIMEGKDLIGQAQTGTGKTAAFGLPALAKLKFNKTVEILVLTPTRELASQVSDELFRLGQFTGAKSVPVVGGQALFRQVELINRGAQIVVATPGRLLDHLREGRLKRFEPHTVILDEADEMLDMGFLDDIKLILAELPTKRQTLLFSATMPAAIRRLADEFMVDPVHVHLNQKQQTNTDIEQRLHVIRPDERPDALLRILDVEDPSKAIIFCRTKRDVDEVTEGLMNRGYAARAIHGDMSQPARNQTVEALKNGYASIIIATDVAARGLDIRGVTHVINYHAPDNRERYIHRIGRTGRAGETGIAITIATPGDLRNNDMFDKRHVGEFTVVPVPAKAAAYERRGSAMADIIRSTEASEDWASVCEDLVDEFDAQDLVARLFTIMMGKRKILGKDPIGLPVDQARKMLLREPSNFGRSGGGRPFPPKRYGNGSSSGPRRDGPRGNSNGPRTYTPRPNDGGSKPRYGRDDGGPRHSAAAAAPRPAKKPYNRDDR